MKFKDKKYPWIESIELEIKTLQSHEGLAEFKTVAVRNKPCAYFLSTRNGLEECSTLQHGLLPVLPVAIPRRSLRTGFDAGFVQGVALARHCSNLVN
jgi:hypothetical protein